MAKDPQNSTGRTPADSGEGHPAPDKPVYDRVEATGTYQMLWDCKYCATKKLLAVTHKFCPGCGAAQDAQARYFPSDEEAVELAAHEYSGADRKCASCGTANAAKAQFCTQCGSPMKDAHTVSLRSEQVAAEGTAFAADSRAQARADFDAQPADQAEVAAVPVFRKRKWYIAGGLAGAAAVALIAGFLVTRPARVKVESHSWQRVVKIEALEAKQESVWCSALPYDAYGVVRRREVSASNQVADGETCDTVRVDKGDGSFGKERRCKTRYKSVPVYSDKCYYRVDRWQHKRDLVSQGDLRAPLTWPAVSLRGGNCRGCEREAERYESFYLVLAQVEKPEKRYQCAYPESQWRAIADGDLKSLRIRLLGGAKCDSLQ